MLEMRLGVNIDHVATLREARGGFEPEPVFAGLIAQESGADFIVAHLREDRRHIKENDLYLLKSVLKIKLNLEMSVAPEIVNIAFCLKPDRATFVPEKRRELTTEGGLDVVSGFSKIKKAADKLKNNGITVSLFIDPDKIQIDASKRAGIKLIELHTGNYADSKNKTQADKCFRQIQQAAKYAKEIGLSVFAGHGLDYCNVSRIAGIPQIEELNIGYSIITRAIFSGLGRAVREMKELI